MTQTLIFNALHQYDPADAGITVPVMLKVGERQVKIPETKLDTGATHCIFQQEYGEALGLDIESGIQKWFGTATG